MDHKSTDVCKSIAEEYTSSSCSEDEEVFEQSLSMSRNSAASVESLNTLLMRLPEISIPPPIYNPLPLQCLAASALPDVIKRDIEEVIAEVSQSPSELENEGQEGNGVALEETDSKEEDELQGGNEVMNVIVKRAEFQEESDLNELEDLGLKITGGVKCDTCSCLHAVVTKVSTKLEPLREIKEGMCVVEWCGQSLEGCSFEEVRRILNESRDSNYNEVEIAFKKCSNNNLISFRRSTPSPKHLTTAFGLKFNRNRNDIMNISSERPADRSTSLEVTIEADHQSSPFTPTSLLSPESTTMQQQQQQQQHESEMISSSHLSKNNARKSGRNFFNVQRSQPNLFGPKRPQRATFHTQQSLPDTLDSSEQQQRPASLALSGSGTKPYSPASSPVEPSGAVGANSGAMLKSNSSGFVHHMATTVKGRAKSPVPQSVNGHQDHIVVNVGGLIQVCLKYDSNFEDLKITFRNVKGQSSQEINDTSGVFLSTFLIPDKRKQGTRNIKVKRDDVTHDSSTSYIIYESELPNVALRVVLWDAHRSKHIVFRGEVLLGLSDQDIVNLNGEPTWYTVCPEDPNLPRLSRPTTVHNKQKGVASVEHLLQRFKNNLSTALKQHTFKSSASIPNLSLPQTTNHQLAPVMRRNMSLSKKELRRNRKSLSGSYSPQAMFDMLETEIENTCGSNPSLDEVKQQLSAILKVLREAENTEKEVETDTEAVKRTKLSNIVRVLQGNGENMQYRDSILSVPSASGATLASDENSFSTLDYRVRKRNHLTLKQNTRPRSDSFKVIPDLRDSLGAGGGGKKEKVTVYSFLEEIENSFSQQKNLSHDETQPDTQITTKIERHNDFTRPAPVESQAHYKIVDSCQSEDELDSPTKGGRGSHGNRIGAKSVDHGMYPAEVSLHRINVVDVDKKLESEQKSQRSKTLPNTCKPTTTRPITELPLALNLSSVPRHELLKQKRRPRSVGDLDDLDDEEELLLVRLPLTSHHHHQTLEQEESTDYLNAVGPISREPITTVVDLENEEVDGEVFSSLDYTTRHSVTNFRTSFIKVEEECDYTASSLDSAERCRALSDETYNDDETSSSLDITDHPRSSLAEYGGTNEQPHPNGHERTGMVQLNVSNKKSLVPLGKPEKAGKKSGIAKWRSLDNLLGNQPTKKTKSKKKTRKGSFMTPAPPAHTSVSKTNSLSESGSRAAGKIKLELQFNTLNPLHPVLIVKILDVVFQSPKLSSSDLSMKGYLYHSSTGVCVLKNKTVVNVKNPFPSAPMGILQFETEITNLRLQVCLCANGKLFSKKTVGEVCLDLNSLELGDIDRPFSKWLELTKVALN